MKLISISSGKGGVGKTTMTCHLAMTLAKEGQKVLIVDGDLGMANVDLFFGVHPRHTILDVINGVPLVECIVAAAPGIDLLAGGSGLYELTQTNSFQRREILNQIQEMKFKYDYVLIDTAPGLHEHVMHLNAVADECMVIITEDPSSFADAYALIKVLNQKHKKQKFQIVCNMVEGNQGEKLFLKFSEVVEKFLSLRLSYAGSCALDQQLKRYQNMQRLILRQTNHVLSDNFKTIADRVATAKSNTEASTDLSNGLEGLFRPVSGHA